MTTRKYGWIKDRPDHRDRIFTVEEPTATPMAVDLRAGMPPVYDQGQLGSCTANAIAGALEFDQLKQKEKSIVPSRLFIYYNERVIENDVANDYGAQIRDGVSVVHKLGACPETEWPYIHNQFAVKPSAACYTSAKKYESVKYEAVMLLQDSIEPLEQALAAGYPVIFGFTVYESFESQQVAATGIVPIPAAGESIVGGHAVLACGYKQIGETQYVIVRNSWGAEWGDHGYCYIPAVFFSNLKLVSDMWTITAVK